MVSQIRLAPDAGLVKSLGANHTLESALADLIDNSLDAAASRVIVRLLTRNDRLARVEVLDNGRGLNDVAANRAMTLGEQRDYRTGDLGHFGMGLKAASFAHCDVLTLWSQSAESAALGRRIRRADFSKDFSCEVLSMVAADSATRVRQEALDTSIGTSVIWTQLRNTYNGRNNDEARVWLSNTQDAIRAHLGVVFHRWISSGRLSIEVQVDDHEKFALGLGVKVTPVDPFGYASSGHPDYPKTLVARAGEARVSLECHIWPAKSDKTGYRIAGRPGEQFQGFFVYRNDRLLQVGGWSELANRSPKRQLARIVLDDASAIGPFLRMNPEKHALRFEPTFHDAVSHAIADDDTTFDDFLRDAEEAHAKGNRRSHSRRPAIAPDKGFAPQVRRIISNELPLISGQSLRLQWQRMAPDEFLDIDFPTRTLWLNSRYRQLFSPERGSLNDAPVLKSLLYLLTHEVFEGQHLGIKDKDNIDLWKSVLGAAAAAEWRMRQGDSN